MNLLPRDLFRRNLIGLLVVVGALSVLYLTKYHDRLSAYRQTVTPEHIAAAGGTAEAGGLTWGIGSVRYRAELSGPLPQGTGAVVVTVARDGAGPDVVCHAVLTDGTRRWQAEGIAGTVAKVPPGATGNCSAPGPVQFTFIVPQDVRPTAVDVLDATNAIMVRLQV